MDIRAIKTAATQRLGDKEKRLALIFVAVQAAVVLLVNLIDLLVKTQMDKATGLAGLGTRQIWETVRTIVFMVASFALPFWSFGYMRVGMAAARGERTDNTMLLAGYHRLFPLLRLTLLRFAILTGLAFAAMYGASFLYLLSPLGMGFMEQVDALMPEMEAMLAQGETALTTELMENLMSKMWPVYLLGTVGAAVLVIPMFYRLRLADYAVLDGENRARTAMWESRLRSRGHKFRLFKLDLSFWWYYLMMAVASGVSCLDLFLPRWGIAVDPDTAYWICLLVSIGLQTLVGYFGIPRLHTAYAIAYDALTPNEE